MRAFRGLVLAFCAGVVAYASAGRWPLVLVAIGFWMTAIGHILPAGREQ